MNKETGISPAEWRYKELDHMFWELVYRQYPELKEKDD